MKLLFASKKVTSFLWRPLEISSTYILKFEAVKWKDVKSPAKFRKNMNSIEHLLIFSSSVHMLLEPGQCKKRMRGIYNGSCLVAKS